MQVFVKSAVRIRPFVPSDQPNDVVCVSALPHLNQIVLDGQNFFTVDYALPVNYSQSQVFEVSVQPMVSYILQGHDTSVVVYGQSNSGKTYTLFGPGLHCAFSEADYGIVPRAVREIFTQLMHGTRRYKVRITFIEIIGESIRDLLGTSQVTPVLEDKNGRTFVRNLNEIECHSVREVFNWLHIGMSSRQASEHLMNARFGCSHSVFTIILEQEWFSNGVQQQIHSQAQFTDLAGLNSVYLNHAMESGLQRLHFDNGLLALENMIVALSDPSCEHNAIFYVNTVLTRILKNSYGGTDNTLFICCVSPLSLDFRETLHSLQLAVQARNVKNFLTLNVCRNTNTFFTNSSEKKCSEEMTKVPEKLNSDVFGLSFAASQWLKLVASAENLFSELATNTPLASEMKDQIEHWLCLKQECEECIESDRGMSDSVSEGRLLYRIDELTEPEERNSSVSSECGSSHVRCDSMFGSNIGFPDFSEKLDSYIKVFKNQTDSNVKVVEEKFYIENCGTLDSNLNANILPKKLLEDSQEKNEEELEHEKDLNFHQGVPPKMLSARRNSICQVSNSTKAAVSEFKFHEMCESQKTEQKEAEIAMHHTQEYSNKFVDIVPQLTDLSNMLKQLKLLTVESDGNPTNLQQVIINFEDSLKGIEELKQYITMKEQLLGKLINDELKLSLKHFQHSSNKFVVEYLKMKNHGVHLENPVSFDSAEKNKSPENIGKCGDGELPKLSQLEKSHKEIKDLERTTVSAIKTILERETSSQQVNELKIQLQREMKHKHELENEIAADKEKIKELEEKFIEQEKQMAVSSPSTRLQWIQEEERRLMNVHESALHLREELLKQQNLLEKREAFLKEKVCLEKRKSEDETEINSRISHLSHVLRERSDPVEISKNEDDKKFLRLEICNLRKTRDILVDQLCSLDEKFQKENILTNAEERKLLECDEAIEAIDAAIEFKNQQICGLQEHDLLSIDKKEKNEEMLLARLMKLSSIEIRTLLCRYFKKVVDLRESGRKMEVQLAELDIQADAQTWKIHALSSALQKARVEAERQVISLQKEHEDKMHLMLRRFTRETSSDSDVESSGYHYSTDALTKYKHENKNLRRRVQEMEAVICMSDHAGDETVCSSPVTIPRRNLKQLQGVLAPYTTKVTRQKNKLIIQQQSKKPNHKR